MTAIIIPETINADTLPGIWSPVQWELTEEERLAELDQLATASLLWAVDVPEAILRLLLDETAIERAYDPPEGYDPEQQGGRSRPLCRRVRLESVERQGDSLVVIYNLEGAGYWELEITPERVVIQRI
jgi:hypothetical protein